MPESSDATAAVSFSKVAFAPAGRAPIFSNITWSIPAGHVVFLAGDSGGGKSTLLRLVNRLLEPSSGGVACAGKTVGQWDIRALRKHAVYVPQRPSLLGETLEEDLRTAIGFQDLSRDTAQLREALSIAQLDGIPLERDTQGLSEGERGRLGVARALLMEPRVLILDEPTAALDPRTAAALLRALRTWAADAKRTLMIITHRLDEPRLLDAQTVFLLERQLFGPFNAAALDGSDLPQPVRAFCDSSRVEGSSS